MGKIKAGVIGVGYLGRFHAQKYAALENAELVGVVDIDADKAAQVARECQLGATRIFGIYCSRSSRQRGRSH